VAIEAMVDALYEFRDGTLSRGEIANAWRKMAKTCKVEE
jgi:hypothetical protein